MSMAEKLIAKGELVGEARGELRGRTEMLLRQLALRVGSVPAETARYIRTADVQALDEWSGLVLAAPSLDARALDAAAMALGSAATLERLARYMLEVRDDLDLPALEAEVSAIDPEAGAAFTTAAEKFVRAGELLGEARGAAKGRAEMLLAQMAVRFGTVPVDPTEAVRPAEIPADVAERVRGADIPTLDRWAERVLTASSIDDVLAG